NIILWDLVTRRSLWTIHKLPGIDLKDLVFTQDNATLVGLTHADTLEVRSWDVRSGELLRLLSPAGPGESSFGALSADGRLAALDLQPNRLWFGMQFETKVYDIKSGGELAVLPTAASLALAPDGKAVALCGRENGIFSLPGARKWAA